MFCAQVQSCYPSFSTTMFEPNHIARKLSNTCEEESVNSEFLKTSFAESPFLCRLLRIEANAKADRILHALFINMFGNPPSRFGRWSCKPGRLLDFAAVS